MSKSSIREAVKAMTDEQLEAAIEEIQAHLGSRAGDRAKLIEGTARDSRIAGALTPDDKPKRPNNYGCTPTLRSGRRSAGGGSACRRLLTPDLTMSGRDKWRVSAAGAQAAQVAIAGGRESQSPPQAWVAGSQWRGLDARYCISRCRTDGAGPRLALYRKDVLSS